MSVEMSKTTDGTDFQDTTRRNHRVGGDDLHLANSRVSFELGPAGVIARVDHSSGRVDYAGPLTDATIDALRDVGATVQVVANE